MFRFSYESFFETKAELREEIAHLLWQIDNTWPMGMYPQQLSWFKDRINTAVVKLNGGARRQSIDNVKGIHQHVVGCKFCPPLIKGS